MGQLSEYFRVEAGKRAASNTLMRGRALLLALVLISSGLGSDAAIAQAPRIAKPRPAPPGPTSLPPLPPAAIDNSLAIGGDEVKARKLETRLSVDVMVNGSGPYKFIVDSGADTSAVGLRIAHALQLPLGTPAVLDGMSDRDIVDRVKVSQLSVGPSTIRDLELPALKEGDLGADGMIGIDALVRQRLMMDFDKRVIKVEDASIPEKISPDEIVIVARSAHGQLILTHVTAAGLPLDAVIDTGSEITIGNIALRDRLLRGNRDKFVTVPVTDVTGAKINVQIARIDELKLGSVTLRDLPMAFADVPPFKIFGLSNQPALLLGTDVLQNFRRVSLDFRARRVRFQLKHCGETVLVNSFVDTFTRLSAIEGQNVCTG
ncbi:MAG TPA: retroviral-like aspartic protease family protein [Sphingomicrobium sp.]|nr:retroviral-like aspartic protease family protein [Sphingomicrobium sp.]